MQRRISPAPSRRGEISDPILPCRPAHTLTPSAAPGIRYAGVYDRSQEARRRRRGDHGPDRPQESGDGSSLPSPAEEVGVTCECEARSVIAAKPRGRDVRRGACRLSYCPALTLPTRRRHQLRFKHLIFELVGSKLRVGGTSCGLAGAARDRDGDARPRRAARCWRTRPRSRSPTKTLRARQSRAQGAGDRRRTAQALTARALRKTLSRCPTN
jgi:hypothetical protein